MRALAGFVGAMKLKYGDVEVGIDMDPEEGLADTGDLDVDLSDLLQAVGEAARERSTVLALFIDELQHIEVEQLGSLIAAPHRSSQKQLPVTLIGAGLPQIARQTGRAKSYAERLRSRGFDLPAFYLDSIFYQDTRKRKISRVFIGLHGSTRVLHH